MNALIKKIIEVITVILPVVIFVVILNLTLVPVSAVVFFRFIIGALALVAGLTVLLFGVDLAFLPLGSHMGKVFVSSNKLLFVLAVVLILGFFVNFAEPDVSILASQVASVTGYLVSAITIRSLVAAGTGILLALGAARIVKNFPLRIMMIIIYGLVLFMALFASPDFLAIAFDASGAATGAITVPLVLALSLGMAAMEKDSLSAEENSFGLVGIMASGAIFGVLFLNFFVDTGHLTGMLEVHGSGGASVMGPFIEELPLVAAETLISLLPIIVIFIIFQKFKFHLTPKRFRRMLKGFIYSYIGLVIFFTGVHAGFMNMGKIIGHDLALGSRALLIGLGSVLGMLVILTEPAVYVLTHQIEDVTNGFIKRKTVLVFLAAGVAFAVGLSMLKILVPQIMLWHYLLPGFVFSIVMMFFTPKIFTGISFDSGAVSSGPMTATFILAFSQGASEAVEHSDVLRDSFGIIAMVTMMPIIALQVLGLVYKFKSGKTGV